ncbi:fimbrial assembly family protein [Gottschalkia acidurici 9a]|uniref:Fimbrial assembly family protein n=1 Tax=Gottschalkia acidurici (strain ATCC 7906 / DSM 604 / BCRC 14475 / CIP 104303 / KCTC 5404 / NCIMB 10678 / 9a) TaxID=1128398 RepID=K0AYE6_GOTA9|nr:fimbrial assembly family protein [Gottschalkia acidurici]AFS78284.1 fimbrial assembly family protein [Gottschalkia acidurici 9a]
MSILVIETNEQVIRACVLKKGIKGYSLVDCIKIPKESGYEILTSDELLAVMSRITNCPKNVVIVTSLATIIETSMDKDKVKKMTHSYLKEAIKWEIEPFITDSVTDSIVGYEIIKKSREEMKDIEENQIWVSVISKNEYEDIKRIMDEEGLKLKRIYPTDSCIAETAMYTSKVKNKIIIDIGEKVTKLVQILNGRITEYKELSLGVDDIHVYLDNLNYDDLIKIFNDSLQQWEGSKEDTISKVSNYMDISFYKWNDSKEEIILSGIGASDEIILDFFTKNISSNIEVVYIEINQLSEFSELKETEFAAILGAGIRELSINRSLKTIGIDDTIELSRIIRERVHIMPIVALVSILVVFIGHYGFIKYRTVRVNSQITTLEGKKAEIEGKSQKYEALKNDKEQIEKSIAKDNEQIELLRWGIRENTDTVAQILKAVQENSTINLHSVNVLIDNQNKNYSVTAESSEARDLNNFIVGIQGKEWCEYADIKNIDEIESKGDEDEENQKKINYSFSIDIVKDSYENK